MNAQIRLAEEKDVDRLYNICCAVQLRPKSEKPDIEEAGFLMSDYESDPTGMKKHIRESITNSELLAAVAELDGKIVGWLLGYSKAAWLDEGWSSDIDWRLEGEKAQKENYILFNKAAVHPVYQKKGIAKSLYEYFVDFAKSQGIDNLFAEIVEDVLRGPDMEKDRLGIKNNGSIGFFEAMGAKRVGESKKPYHYPASFLGEKGHFLDGIYLAKLTEKAKFYK